VSAGRLAMAAAVGLLLGASGCGPNCQSSCQILFGEAPDYCALAVPGKPLDQSRKACIQQCDQALATAGDLGSYDPNSQNVSGATVHLENEKQAAAWMDCVDQHSCQDLSEGFCAPTGF
jgi:hypothetical protein